jgi:hypothetical protein
VPGANKICLSKWQHLRSNGDKSSYLLAVLIDRAYKEYKMAAFVNRGGNVGALHGSTDCASPKHAQHHVWRMNHTVNQRYLANFVAAVVPSQSALARRHGAI